MPCERYRLYHVEKAKGGIALTMTAGSASVSRDSPPAFGNLLARKNEMVPHLKRLADDCHGYGTAVMADPSRPSHQLEQGRLAAGSLAVADPRNRPPAFSERERRLGYRTHH